MIISRTPFRVSFAGGGTDLKSYYSVENGQVISTSIDKYLYVVVRRQIGLVELKYRLNYTKPEFCDTVDEIKHPIVREAFKMFGVDYPIEVTTFADIPSHTGLGSSSAFAVGLVHALYALRGQHVTKSELAKTASALEGSLTDRAVGKQDHYASAYGGLNVFTFYADGRVLADPVFYSPAAKRALESHLMLYYTGLNRDASTVLRAQEARTAERINVLRAMRDQVCPIRDIICTGENIIQFGKILHEGWMLKRSITPEISCSAIDAWYNKAIEAGAIGGKLLGAGGGGFLLLFVEPGTQQFVQEAMRDLYRVNFGFDDGGSRITYYDMPVT